MTPTFSKAADISLGWGESLHWDDRRQRLYFVDCVERTVHWLDHGSTEPATVAVPSMPTGLVLTTGDQIIVVLDDGLNLIDPDSGTIELLAANPEGLPGRFNDAHVDQHGNIVTGSLGIVPDPERPGSYWWYSSTDGWRLLDTLVGNANGPLHVDLAGESTLLIADTEAAEIYRYQFDSKSGEVGDRQLFASTLQFGGVPDGSTLDEDGNPWWTMCGGSTAVQFADDGTAATQLALPVDYPTSLAFGGPDLDVLYVVAISITFGPINPIRERSNQLVAVTDLGVGGKPEPRFQLATG